MAIFGDAFQYPRMLMKTLKFENLKIHIVFWTIYISYELAVIYSLGGKFSNFPDYAGHYLLNIATFYFNAHVVLPNAVSENKKSYITIPSAILAEIILYLLLKLLLYQFYQFAGIQISTPIVNIWFFIISSTWRAVFFIGLSTAYWLALSTIQNRKTIADLENTQLRNQLQTQALEKTLLTTENAYLKSQINPHFLLNTLNFLYNSVSKYSEKIAESVLLLSDIMRYALTNADEDGKVRLEAEIDHINSFIKLNQARYDERLCIDFLIDGEIDECRIIPLILITLAENVFKYGDLLNESYPARITASVENNNLTFVTQNLKRKKIYYPGYGIGINNIKSRLEMYYKYELSVEEDENEYKSTLKIEL
jgi:two-component system, LytTR family, sensor kinase